MGGAIKAVTASPLIAAQTVPFGRRFGGWILRGRPGVTLPADEPQEDKTVAAIMHCTSGNYRLLYRLLTQMERILVINGLSRVTRAVVEAARESLVIRQT